LLLFALQCLMAARWWGLLLLPYGVVMLFLCWGPRDLDGDARALAEAEDEAASQRARSALGIGAGSSSGAVVAGVFRAGLDRWFGPLLWFVLLGGAGALLYRSVSLATVEPPRVASPMDWLWRVLNWPAAALMALSLALVAHFDAVLGAWKRWHAVPERSWFGSDIGFLDVAAQASVVCELQEDVEDAADDAEAEREAPVTAPSDEVVPTVQAAVEDSLGLLWRILLLWMAGLALAVLGGIAG
jgi:AmpE protein